MAPSETRRRWFSRGAMVAAIASVALPAFLIPSLALAFAAILLRDRTRPLWPSMGIGALVLNLFAGAGWVAIGVPHYFASQKRIAQQECLVGLRAVALAQAEHYAREKTYATRWAELDFTPQPSAYSFFLTPTERVGPERPFHFDSKLMPGVTGICPNCGFRAACVGQLDGDSTLDAWSVASDTSLRTNPEGETAVEPLAHVDDVLN